MVRVGLVIEAHAVADAVRHQLCHPLLHSSGRIMCIADESCVFRSVSTYQPLVFFAHGYPGEVPVGTNQDRQDLHQNRLDGPFPAGTGGC